MDLEAVRDRLALAAGTHEVAEGRPKITGYREPAGELNLPALVVLDPIEIRYYQTWDGTADVASFRLRLVAPLTLDDASARELDRLLSSGGIAATLESHDPEGAWSELRVLGTTPGLWGEYRQGDTAVGVSVDLDVRLIFPDPELEPDEEPEPDPEPDPEPEEEPDP